MTDATEPRSLEVDVTPSSAPPPRRGCRVLVTNDDGIDSPGLQRLAAVLAEVHDVVIAAPASNMSGTGTGIGRLDRTGVELDRRHVDGVAEAYAIAGPPGLAVMACALGAFGGMPDVVVSGINAGLNTGNSIIHSGTVGAALTAHTFGARSLAISLAPSDPWQWDTAVPVAAQAAQWVLASQPQTVLNVNVPAVPPDQVRGVRWAPVDAFGHFSVATADIEAAELQLDVADRSSGVDPQSDTALCLAGYVTLTLLEPVVGAPLPDVPAEQVVAPEVG